MRGAINSGSLAHDQLDVRVAGVVEAGTNVALAHTECTTPKGSCGGAVVRAAAPVAGGAVAASRLLR